jgi:hypothetical protein
MAWSTSALDGTSPLTAPVMSPSSFRRTRRLPSAPTLKKRDISLTSVPTSLHRLENVSPTTPPR